MDALVSFYFCTSLAPSTMQSYRSLRKGICRFVLTVIIIHYLYQKTSSAVSWHRYLAVSHLSFSEITVISHDKTSVITLKIKASKTDPFTQGVTIYLGATGMKLCPVKSLLAYIATRD